MAKARKARGIIALLDNWNTLNASLMGLREKDVARLLAHEQEHQNRLTFTLRLHSRLNKLRRERERRKIVASTGRNIIYPPGE